MQNKPKVFLSHSKKDTKFIKKLHSDLNTCNVNPWLDEINIRSGEPWLNAIFEAGIPTCDSVFVYLTTNSIESDMVKKEIDSALIHKLNDNDVGFLPFIDDKTKISSLRSDLQAIQIIEFNSENYNLIFPRIISEIWGNYLKKMMSSALNNIKEIETRSDSRRDEVINQLQNYFNEEREQNRKLLYEYSRLKERYRLLLNRFTKYGR